MKTESRNAADGLAALLQEAGAATRMRPDTEHRTELDHQLRAHLRRLVQLVTAQRDGLTPRTRDWYARDAALEDACAELAGGLSPSPLAACLKLASLARSVRTLDQYAGGES